VILCSIISVNKKLFFLRNALLFLIIFFFQFHVHSQVVLFSENMGTPSGTTAITSNSFQNATLSFSGSSDVRATITSSGYTDASGGGNIFITSTIGRDFVISGISTVNYSNLVLSFGAHKSTTASNLTELVLEYSLDGTNYTTITFPSQATGSGTTVWRLISGVSFPAGAAGANNLRIRFRQTSSLPQFRIDDIKLVGTLVVPACTSPTSLSFQTQPSNVLQDATMSPAVQVAAICSDGTVATGYTGNVTLTVNASGCGYTTQTVSFVNGVGTFNSIVFTRSPQSNLTFTATSSGLTSATSTPFNVNAPAGAPTVSTIIQNNFDAIQTWGYSVGTAISVGSGGSAGTDVVGIVTEAGTGVLRKSFSVNNTSSQQGSKNTITFDNVSGLSPYSSIDFTFNVLSFGSGSGSGNDSGEDFSLDVSTDNGATWTTVLIQYGYSNRLFPQSASPVTSLSLSSITYAPPTASSGPDTRSAFLLTLTGISQFCFRFTAQNNRSEENWAIDNPKLTGTTYGVGVPFNLPIVNLGNDIQFCSGNSVQLSSTLTSVLNPVSYSWNPSTWLNNATISNPTVTGLASSQTYTLTVTDADNCTGSDQITVSVLYPPEIIFLSPP
jgi:hypothetical protein